MIQDKPDAHLVSRFGPNFANRQLIADFAVKQRMPGMYPYRDSVMEVLLRDFWADQIFGLNGLVNLANFAFLLAFSVRDVLKLRILSLASDVMLLPYYYFQHKPLWSLIFWGVAFIIVNGVRIVTLTLARRPVILSNKEEELHRVAFGSIDKRDFLKMACLARWVDFSPGEVIVKKSHRISEAIVLISGEAEGVLSGKTILTYCPGQLIGNVSAYSGLVCPMDVVAQGPTRVATWDLEHMREFTESRPELRAKLLQIMSTDLAAKLHESITNKQVESESSVQSRRSTRSDRSPK